MLRTDLKADHLSKGNSKKWKYDFHSKGTERRKLSVVGAE